MKIIGLLPARLNSTRIQRKLLHKICKIPLIVHTILIARLSKMLTDNYVCTDSKKIKNCTKNFAKTFITKTSHINGTERIAEVARKIKADFIIYIHADEAMLEPANIDKLIKFHKKNNHFDIVVPHKIANKSGGKNIVKIISDQFGKVLYFTRSEAPYGFRQINREFFHHLDIISFKPKALIKITKLKRGKLESIEGIELMRAIENNMKVGTFPIKTNSFSINTPRDLKKAKTLMKKDKLYRKYSEKFKQ